MPPDATRSRSGCATCRRRRKKCDETWDDVAHPGTCRRCFSGSFTCDRSALPRQPAKPRTARPQVPSPLAGGMGMHLPPPPRRASTSATPPLHPFASTSHAPYNFPELEAQPFLANFFSSLDDLPYFNSDQPLDYDANSAAATLAGVLANPHGASPVPSSSDVDELGDNPFPFYNQFNESFLRSIPNPLRKILTKRVDDVAASHELTRTSSLAVVLLYRARSQAHGPEARAKLIEQSDEHFQASLQHLQAPIPLEAQMIAVLDLQYHQFDSAGSAAAISVIRLGELFVTTSLGENPRINFETLTDPDVVPLRCFAYAEVLGAVYIKGRRTIFDIAHLPDADDDAPTPGALPSGDARFETHLGLPVGILLCLASISNLSVELDRLESDVVERRRDMIEAAIRQWRPSRIPGGEGSDSVSFLEEVRISEIWRQAALIHLFQSIHRYGPHHTLLRHSLSQILSLIQRHDPSQSFEVNHTFTGSLLAAPLVLAAMIATAPDDREQCRQVLVSCGQQMGYQHNLAAVERVWAVTDQSGWTVDWRDVLEKEGLVVTFL